MKRNPVSNFAFKCKLYRYSLDLSKEEIKAALASGVEEFPHLEVGRGAR
jgi:hypothetical protein